MAREKYKKAVVEGEEERLNRIYCVAAKNLTFFVFKPLFAVLFFAQGRVDLIHHREAKIYTSQQNQVESY